MNKIPNSSAIRHLELSTEISGNLPFISGVRKVGILLNKSAQADAVGHGRPVEGIPAIHGEGGCQLICYDIACPRRLQRIHRTLKGQAMALQYSVFLFSGTPEQLDRCLAQLERLMDTQQDDIRAYPLPERGLRWCRGQPLLPDGIYWSGLPLAWQNTPLGSEKSDKMPPAEAGTP